MTKREIIDRIRRLNPTAETEFLASFEEDELLDYLHHLQEIEPELLRRTAEEPVGTH